MWTLRNLLRWARTLSFNEQGWWKALEEITKNHGWCVRRANSTEEAMGKRRMRGIDGEKKDIATFPLTFGVVDIHTTSCSSSHLDRDGAEENQAYDSVTNNFPQCGDNRFPGTAKLRRQRGGDEVKRRGRVEEEGRLPTLRQNTDTNLNMPQERQATIGGRRTNERSTLDSKFVASFKSEGKEKRNQSKCVI
uniref:Uncharacterized protein n=1 Tax=Oryza punctata TaxID=4537 RepID=A0A0E0K8H8_ORYPU